ncbi:MAG: PQQ-binding-like beta-propeller repeat protein [Verrucomicrobiota bacterium]|mgnify:CR=1 FL=1
MSRIPPLLLSLGLLTAPSLVRASDWSSWRGPARDGQSPETGWSHEWPSDGPRILWKAGVGTGFSSMVVSDGRLYTMGWSNDEDHVFCLNAVTGATNWIARYPQGLGNKMYEGGPNSTPLVVGNRVFTASKTGLIHAFDTATGNPVWKKSLKEAVGAELSDWGVSGAPVLADARTLLINYGPHGVALDPETGAVRWSSGRKKDMSFAAPVVLGLEGKPAALFFMSEALVAVDPSSGEELWRSSFGKGYRTHCSDPLVAGNRVFISSGDDGGELLEVTLSGAKRLWKNANLSTFTGTAVLVGQHLFGLDTAGYKGPEQELRCVDLATGSVKWGEKGFGQGSLIAAGDRLIVQGDRGEVSVVRASPERFELLARCQPIGGKCWTTPALSDGRLYVRNARGDLACLDLNSAASNSR